MFYSQVILAKKGPLAKVWLAAHWGDKKLARPQIFATDISQSCTDIMNPSVPLALRLSGHLLLGVVRIYSRKVKYVLNDCTEAMLKLQMAFAKQSSSNNSGKGGAIPLDANGNPMMGQLGSRELLNETDANAAHQLVANFGEFDRVHVVEGFCLPLPEDNEWILADESGNAYSIGGLGGGGGGATASVDGDGSSSRDPGLLLAAHTNTNNNNNTNLRTNGDEHDDEEEEAWAPFDPDNEDEEDDNDNMPNNSRVSDIEIVRAANDSLLSEDQTRRASTSFLDKSALTTDTPVGAGASASANPAEDDYDFNVPFGEDDSEDENGNPNANANANANANTPFGAANLDDSALQLSRDGGTPLGANGLALALAMDDDDENDSQANAKRLSSEMAASTTKPPPRKRRRKRRKVVIDNHETELTNDHIRTMLQHTDDIVAVMIHPASLWDEEDHRKDYKTLALEERAKQQLEQQQQQQQDGAKSKRKKKKKNGAKNNDPDAVPCLTRPFLADGSGPSLHPVLQRLWQDNYWKALGEPCPYQKQEAEDDDDDKVVDDVEKVRRDARAEDDESTLGGEGSDLDVTKEKMDEENLSQSQLPEADFDFPTAVDDEEEEDDDAPVPDFGDDEDETAALHKAGNDNDNDNGDLLDLGMVNDMILDSDEDKDEDDEDANRQALGELSSSSTKWHKHTVRVFQHLKKCLHDPNNANDADADIDADDASSTEPQPESVGFDELTKHVVSRRNASSIFFEMLQLKTWDFIELNQDESYGSIAISAGVRFGEDAPNN